MKKNLLWLLLALPGALFAQIGSSPPPEKPSAYLDVKLSAGDNKTSHTFQGDPYFKSDATKQNVRSMAVTIDAGTLMHSPLDAQIEWFFVEKDLKTKHDHIFDHGTKNVTLKAGSDEQFEAVSKEVKSTVTNETIFGMSELSPRVSGGKPDGWIVRITAGGTVLVLKASSPVLEDEGNDPNELEKLQSANGGK